MSPGLRLDPLHEGGGIVHAGAQVAAGLDLGEVVRVLQPLHALDEAARVVDALDEGCQILRSIFLLLAGSLFGEVIEIDGGGLEGVGGL